MADEVQVIEEGGIVVATVLESACAAIWPALQPKVEAGAQSFVLDFSEVSYLNSMSIASIISLRNKILTAGGKLALANLQDAIKSVFRILKLEKLFDLDMNGEEARTAVK